jgi:hypothetical protein
MKARIVMDSWEAVSKKAYWDRDVPLGKWREKVREGHMSYLPDAVSAMSVAEFVRFYGTRRFLLDWPAMRAALPVSASTKVGMYDIVWSRLAGGGWNLKPVPDFYRMPERRRQFLVQVARVPGKSIYTVAKSLNMQYRRAHDHAKSLLIEGKIRAVEAVEGGRRKLKLFAVTDGWKERHQQPSKNVNIAPSNHVTTLR